MRKIREVLCLHHDAGMGIRAISRSLKASPSTVREYLIRAKVQGLSWPLPESLDDAGLLRRLFPMPAQSTSRFPPPGWSKVRRELRRKGVTLALLWEEYKTVHPEGCSTDIDGAEQSLQLVTGEDVRWCRARPSRFVIGRGKRRPYDVAAADRVAIEPGMPAEVTIVTGRRTALEYLLEPIVLSFGRALRKD